MAVFPVLAVGILMKFVAVLFILVSILLILVILIQKGRGGGLSGAFGGGMASGLLGSKTGDFLTWVTIGLVSVFLFLAVIMAKFYRTGVSTFGEETAAPTRQTTQPARSKTETTTPSREANAPVSTAPRTDVNKPATTAPTPEANAPAARTPAAATRPAPSTPAPAPGAATADTNKPVTR
jgi:preprotein translocase subunit SecG